MAPNKIGKKLKDARKKLGLKQSDVAEKAEISVNYYARIERNEENPTLETLERVLKALKLKSSDVLPFYNPS
jgi:transcriptional regulator with XRE-family HTH domain